MQTWRVFCFLWDDPQFNPGPAEGFLEVGKDDPDWLIAKRREMTLDTLNLLFAKITTLETTLAKYRTQAKENRARCTWIFRKFAAHVPENVAEQIFVDIRVNDMDTDFSYRKALGLE